MSRGRLTDCIAATEAHRRARAVREAALGRSRPSMDTRDEITREIDGALRLVRYKVQTSQSAVSG